MQSARRFRNILLSHDMFADPAWDILLDLYVRHLEDRRTSVLAACDAANVPMTTALRWVGRLEEQGLVVRWTDSSDRRRSLIALSEEGVKRMNGYFDALQSASVEG